MLSGEDILQVLRHDLHKIRIAGALAYKAALSSETAQKADDIAAWISRNFLKEPFENMQYRKSLVFQTLNLYNPRTLANQHRLEITYLFQELDKMKLHQAILNSKLLNLYAEARQFPYSSLKYHILLTCALYYNSCHGFDLNKLYLFENIPAESLFQIIYRDSVREWALFPQKQNALTKCYSRFCTSWERRFKISI